MYMWMNDDTAPAADIKLIAYSREDVPYLVETLRQLRDG